MENQNQIIACTTSGRPLTQEQYINKINTAIAQAENGELLTDEELQQEIATW
jgi:predicted transcriptional regulator